MLNYNPSVTRQTARRNLLRGPRFLGTLSRVPEIRSKLAQGAGYTQQDHSQGWDLLAAAQGRRRETQIEATEAAAPLPATDALLQLDGWDGDNFGRARATLRFNYASQDAYIFAGLDAATGTLAIDSVATFIERVVALRDGTDPEREASREQDREAVKRLESRKIFSPSIEGKLNTLLAQAKTLAPLPEGSEPTEELEKASVEFHVWLSDWSRQARSFITGRGDLIRLGLTERKTNSDTD